MWRKHANDEGFELLKLLAWHGRFFDLHFRGEKAAQCLTLVDRKRANDAARIRDGFEPLSLACRQFHFNPPLQGAITIEQTEYTSRYPLRLFHHLNDTKVPQSTWHERSP